MNRFVSKVNPETANAMVHRMMPKDFAKRVDPTGLCAGLVKHILKTGAFARMAANDCHPGQLVGDHSDLDVFIQEYQQKNHLGQVMFTRDNSSWIAIYEIDPTCPGERRTSTKDVIHNILGGQQDFDIDGYLDDWREGQDFAGSLTKNVLAMSSYATYTAALIYEGPDWYKKKVKTPEQEYARAAYLMAAGNTWGIMACAKRVPNI